MAIESALASRMHALISRRDDWLPFPGGGHTIERWSALSEVASDDLSLAKLFEGHTDALAILAELHADLDVAPALWGTWAAESPRSPLCLSSRQANSVTLSGTKAWCSGAAVCDYALVTCWSGEKGPWLAAVPMSGPGVHVATGGWNAVGMSATRSVSVTFENTPAGLVGQESDYLRRPGFWHGGGGIAACWYGGTVALATELVSHMGPAPDVIKLAHLGAVDRALGGASAALRETAAWIDAHPLENAQGQVLKLRAIVEAAALDVIDHSGKALGASAFCLNEKFARMAADLPVYLRQSHAERDLARLGELAAANHLHRWAI